MHHILIAIKEATSSSSSSSRLFWMPVLKVQLRDCSSSRGNYFRALNILLHLWVRDILVAHWTVYSGLSHKSGPCNRASSVQNLRSRGRSFYTCRLAERDNFLNFMQFSAAGISSVSRFFQRTCRHRVDKYLFGQNGLTIGLLQTSLPRWDLHSRINVLTTKSPKCSLIVPSSSPSSTLRT